MKRVIILLIAIMFIFALFGCSTQPKEPTLNLVYDGYTNTTSLIDYRDNSTERNYQIDLGNSYIKVKQGSNLQYKSSNSKSKCTLLIQMSDTKEKVKEVVLDKNSVDTSIPQGKYIYNFLIEWNNGSAKFMKLIEIE